jgi:membrane associated rhomboid family serine protease
MPALAKRGSAVIPAVPQRLSSPRVYLLRMGVFVVLAGFVALILYREIIKAFEANPALNGLIIGVMAVGIILAFRQVIRLFREIRWVNGFRMSEDGTLPKQAPVLLLPMATILANQGLRTGVSPATLRAVLDSIGMRLDEARDIGRYLTGLLVFLGLLGTFWGLLTTISSVGDVIGSMKGGGDAAIMFEELKQGLVRPLAGMGTSFSASLFGLAGSLVLGFLDLQAGQAQNRFYNEVEDWLATTVSEPAADTASPIALTADLRVALDRLAATVSESAGNRGNTTALANLAVGIQALVEHMRGEQQLIRDWVEAQASREAEMKRLLERLASTPERS